MHDGSLQTVLPRPGLPIRVPQTAVQDGGRLTHTLEQVKPASSVLDDLGDGVVHCSQTEGRSCKRSDGSCQNNNDNSNRGGLETS